MLILIGSRALEEYFPINRVPVDYDLIGTYHEIIKWARPIATSFYPFNKGKYMKISAWDSIIEAEIAWPNSSAEAILKYVSNDPLTRDCGRTFPIPSLNLLYMLKMSHRYLKNSPHFLKTMSDIHLMRQHGAHIDDSLKELYDLRCKETYNYSHPNLNQNKENFFKADGVNYVYDHDSIHEAIKLFHQPAYSFFKGENKEVFCSKRLFDSSSREIQLASVYEESCVLAIERSLVPFPNAKTPEQAFKMALMKVCTSITSGWFREFAWENYYDVLKIDPQFTFWDKFQIAVSAGKVPLHRG